MEHFLYNQHHIASRLAEEPKEKVDREAHKHLFSYEQVSAAKEIGNIFIQSGSCSRPTARRQENKVILGKSVLLQSAISREDS
jgi:hypothetical protein